MAAESLKKKNGESKHDDTTDVAGLLDLSDYSDDVDKDLETAEEVYVRSLSADAEVGPLSHNIPFGPFQIGPVTIAGVLHVGSPIENTSADVVILVGGVPVAHCKVNIRRTRCETGHFNVLVTEVYVTVDIRYSSHRDVRVEVHAKQPFGKWWHSGWRRVAKF